MEVGGADFDGGRDIPPAPIVTTLPRWKPWTRSGLEIWSEGESLGTISTDFPFPHP